MIHHRGTLISEDLFEKRFVCDLSACKGACCERGDSGAPLEPEEARLIKKHLKQILPYMNEAGKKAVAEQGTSVIDMDEELVTPLIGEFKHCAYAKKNEQGVWRCGIEHAHEDGKIDFHKPMSCHLYPIRVEKLKTGEALNYHAWEICKPACSCGAKLDVPVFRFLKNALVRKFGEEWFNELEVLYAEWSSRDRPAKRGKKFVR